MKYTFRGQFSGALAPGITEPLAGVTIRLYKYRGTKYVSSLAVADPENSMMILPFAEIAAKEHSLIAEATADAEGKFTLVLGEVDKYHEEAFDIDLFFTTVPGCKSQGPQRMLQISLATMKPRWQSTAEGLGAEWSYCLPATIWREIRAHFDAWIICGRVLEKETQTPLSGIRVYAFDADWIQNDTLGDCLTDDEGQFRIDYALADFTRTPLSPLINAESGGPDLFFRLETESGVTLLSETKQEGNQPGRIDAEQLFFIEFNVEAPVAMPA